MKRILVTFIIIIIIHETAPRLFIERDPIIIGY